MDNTPLPFVGASRRALVEGLVRLFDEVVASGQPRWVALEAPSGWGKTRVATQLYAALAAGRQADPPYWPPAIVDEATDTSARKRVMPQVVHAPGALPQWLWWGVTCALRHRLPSVALAQDVAELEAHAPYLDLTWRARNRGEVVAREARTVFDAGVDHVAGTLLGSVIPAFDIVSQVARFSYRHVREAAERRDLLGGDAAVGADRTDLVEGVVATLRQLADGGVPVVLFVEDAHDADDALAQLLGQLVAGDGPVLLLTSAWPGHAQTSAPLTSAMAVRPDRVVRVEEDGGTLPAPFPPGAGLARLEDEALVQIARIALPPATDDTVHRIVRRYPNPLALELFGSLPALHARARRGPLDLSDEAMARFPPTLVGLYHELWDQLPDEVRRALAFASLGIPSAIDRGAGASSAWNDTLMAQVLLGLGLPDAATVAQSLREAPTAYAWARVVTSTLRAFAEPDQQLVAAEQAVGLVDDEERQAVFDALVSRIVGQLLPAVGSSATADPQEVDHAAQLVVSLHREGFTAHDEALQLAVLAVLEPLRQLGREAGPRRELAGYALRHQGDPAAWARIATLLAELLRTVDLDAALSQVPGLVQEAATRLRPDDPHLLRLRFEQAAVLGVAGRHEEALVVSRDVLARQQAALGPDHPDTLRTASCVAIDVGCTEGAAAALPLYERAAHDRASTLGETDPGALVSLRNLALTLSEQERSDDAVATARRALDLARSAHPPLSSVVVDARATLARVLLDSGRSLEAGSVLAEPGEVVDALGAADPAARALLAQARRLRARLGLSDDDAADLVPAELGPRERLAAAYAHADEVAAVDSELSEALRLHEEVLTQYRRCRPADDPDVVLSERRVIGLTPMTPDERVAALQELLARVRAISNPRATQRSLVHGIAGDLVDALAAAPSAITAADEHVAAVAADPLELPSAVLVARVKAAGVRHSAGQVQESVAALVDVLTDATARLGSVHPMTTAVALDLCAALRATDRTDLAVEIAQHAYETMCGLLDPAEITLRDAARELADALVADGRPLAADEVMLGVLLGRLRRLGPVPTAVEPVLGLVADLLDRHDDPVFWATLADEVLGPAAVALGVDAPEALSLLAVAEEAYRLLGRDEHAQAVAVRLAATYRRQVLQFAEHPFVDDSARWTWRAHGAAATARAGDPAQGLALLLRLADEVPPDDPSAAVVREQLALLHPPDPDPPGIAP